MLVQCQQILRRDVPLQVVGGGENETASRGQLLNSLFDFSPDGGPPSRPAVLDEWHNLIVTVPVAPWEAALGSLDRIVSRLSPSPSQTASLAQPQVAAPDIQQSNLASQVQQPWAYQAPTAQPIYSNNVSTTPISSPTSTAQEPQLSQASAAVVNHFGIEAPGILNQYATTLEDALIQQQAVLEWDRPFTREWGVARCGSTSPWRQAGAARARHRP